jgi:hypothetical protein
MSPDSHTWMFAGHVACPASGGVYVHAIVLYFETPCGCRCLTPRVFASARSKAAFREALPTQIQHLRYQQLGNESVRQLWPLLTA